MNKKLLLFLATLGLLFIYKNNSFFELRFIEAKTKSNIEIKNQQDKGGKINKKNKEQASNEIIIKFKDDLGDNIDSQKTRHDSINNLNKKNKVTKIEKIFKNKINNLNRIYRLEVPYDSDIEKLIEEYKKDINVEYVQPNYIYKTSSTTPDDTYFNDLWGMKKIQAPEAWDISTGTAEIIVAVVDSGVDYNHEDLDGNMWINSGEMGSGKETNGVDDDGNGLVDDWGGVGIIIIMIMIQWTIIIMVPMLPVRLPE